MHINCNKKYDDLAVLHLKFLYAWGTSGYMYHVEKGACLAYHDDNVKCIIYLVPQISWHEKEG